METYAKELVEALISANKKIAAAESCTGGLIAKLLTDVPGCSKALDFSAVTYANEAKSAILRVPEELFATVGAVSSQVACCMANGVRIFSGADFGVATTGIAGPDGGSPQKPVGTVYIAVSCEKFIWVKHCRFDSALPREEIRVLAAKTALGMALKAVKR